MINKIISKCFEIAFTDVDAIQLQLRYPRKLPEMVKGTSSLLHKLVINQHASA
jgi:hypothetical protein